jgi:hypothetical protein
MIRAEQEIARIIEVLGHPHFEMFKKPILDKVLFVQSSFQQRSKYSKVEKLVPLVIYIFLTLRDFKVNKSDLIQVSEIFYEEFNCFFYQLKNYMLNYYYGDNFV